MEKTAELAVWAAVYAASWSGPTWMEPGTPSDVSRAHAAAEAADRAVAALRRIGGGPPIPDEVTRAVAQLGY